MEKIVKSPIADSTLRIESQWKEDFGLWITTPCGEKSMSVRKSELLDALAESELPEGYSIQVPRKAPLGFGATVADVYDVIYTRSTEKAGIAEGLWHNARGKYFTYGEINRMLNNGGRVLSEGEGVADA